MLLGYRTEAIAILGREVMKPRGLIGLGYDSIDNCGPGIAEVSYDITGNTSAYYLWVGIPKTLRPVPVSHPSPLHPGQRQNRFDYSHDTIPSGRPS
jgi:hypothetical protein